mgnify:CR=1 FL=1
MAGLTAGLIFFGSYNIADAAKPIVIQEQGSFAVGGSTVKHEGIFSTKNFLSPEGQKAYGDLAYVFYQIPVKAKKYPLIFQHGGAQSKRTWESTVDGREGFQNIFLRKGYGVYQPRRKTPSFSYGDIRRTANLNVADIFVGK